MHVMYCKCLIGGLFCLHTSLHKCMCHCGMLILPCILQLHTSEWTATKQDHKWLMGNIFRKHGRIYWRSNCSTSGRAPAFCDLGGGGGGGGKNCMDMDDMDKCSMHVHPTYEPCILMQSYKLFKAS